MKVLVIGFLTSLVIYGGSAKSQRKIASESSEQRQERMDWWIRDRFGMFIHWGLYAMPARHEWVKNHEKLTTDQYQVYFDEFNPDLYNPKEWARRAREAGMKYAVLTTKHHEGFCLFDTRFTEYNARNTQAKRDLVMEFVEAFRAEGLKVGFYYSLIDWYHPDFTVDVLHPQRPERNADTAYAQLNKSKDMSRYRTFLFNQVRELLTNYGKIDIMWFDYSYPVKNGKGRADWNSIELLKMVRQLQPGILINNRLDLNDYEDGFDFVTPEQYKTREWPTVDGKRVPWETCQTFSGSWGYNRDEMTWKNNAQLLELLIETVSKGGNLIMNVGPTGRGVFDERAHEKLDAIGAWMKLNSKSVYSCTQAPDSLIKPENTLLTYNPDTRKLYIHLLVYPLQTLVLPGYANKVKYAQFLADNSEIKIVHPRKGENEKDLRLNMPVKKPNDEIPVIELSLK